MVNKQHLTKDGFDLFLSYYAAINYGPKSKNLLFSFPNVKPINKPEHSIPDLLKPNLFSGFVTGDGGFHINIRQDIRYKLGYKLDYNFSITQHNKDIILMNKFIEFFNCGKVFNREFKFRCYFMIQDKTNLIKFVLPHFDQYPLETIKQLDYIEFKECLLLIEKMII
jgi:hypothetical protein